LFRKVRLLRAAEAAEVGAGEQAREAMAHAVAAKRHKLRAHVVMALGVVARRRKRNVEEAEQLRQISRPIAAFSWFSSRPPIH
jgi:hypothetical protein